MARIHKLVAVAMVVALRRMRRAAFRLVLDPEEAGPSLVSRSFSHAKLSGRRHRLGVLL